MIAISVPRAHEAVFHCDVFLRLFVFGCVTFPLHWRGNNWICGFNHAEKGKNFEPQIALIDADKTKKPKWCGACRLLIFAICGFSSVFGKNKDWREREGAKTAKGNAKKRDGIQVARASSP
jgi:hypothetical protein